MKKPLALLSGLLAGALLTAAAPVAHADVKVGVVDMNKIFQAYYKTKDAESKINEQKAAAQKEMESRMDAYRKSLEDIQQINKDLENKALAQAKKDDLAKQRDSKIQENQQLQREIDNFRQTRERQIQEQILRERNRIVEEIMKLIQDKVKSESFDLVFDKSGVSINQVPVVLFSRDNMEFSEDIIKTLNKNKPADSAPAAATPAARPAGGATPAPLAPAPTPKK